MKNGETAGAVCLLSGGMDSCVTLATAISECSFVIPLHAMYGQLTCERERRACMAICEYYGLAEPVLVELPHIAGFGGSALLPGGPAVPDCPESGPEKQAGVPVTYVPFRNGTLLSVAAALAETRGARYIYIGAVEEDSSGYPDCRKAFFEAFEKALNLGTRPETSIEIRTPVIELDKAGIVEKGTALSAPLHLTWSCYRSGDTACGTCDSCRLRLRAFERAGLVDPLPYKED